MFNDLLDDDYFCYSCADDFDFCSCLPDEEEYFMSPLPYQLPANPFEY